MASGERWALVKDLFAAALEREPRDRVAYLDEACADPALRREVEALLDAHAQAGSFLESPAAAQTQATESTAETEPLAEGTRFGPYEILGCIGMGGMGVVYAAYHADLARKVALKLLRPGPGGEAGLPERRARLLREAQAMARLKHPNVITVYDVGTFGEHVFLAMELVEGTTLASWLTARPRTWREILDAFLAAGRGLGAAHAAGLVHRDFKPANVLVGDDGRICVTDFGLARPASQAPTAAPGLLAGPLTLTGAVMGTPAYMAPEQMRGEATDERTDEYAFCVALYEALHGERPFPGDTLEALLRAADSYALRPPSRPHRVPVWIRRALLKGLRPVPAERFPSMTALLAALAKDPRVRRRRLLVAAGLAALLAGSAILYQRGLAAREVCKGAARRLAGVWDPGRAAEVHAAFLGAGKPYTEDTFARVRAELDRYGARWAEVHEEVCEATRVRGEQSEALLERRMLCLEARREELGALAATFARADAEILKNAAQAAARLPVPERCQDRALGELPPPPSDPEGSAALSALRSDLARAKALFDSGKYREARRVAESAVQAARTFGYRPLLAEALQQLGEIQEALAEYATAERTLEESLWVAEGVRHHEVAARAATRLVGLAGYRQTKFDEAKRWARHARAVLDRLGDRPDLEAALLKPLGSVAHNQGRNDEAIAAHQKALALLERAFGPRHLRVADALSGLSEAFFALGRQEEALRTSQQALALTGELAGPRHPEFATAHNNVGAILSRFGRFEEAVAHYQVALAIREAAFGPESDDVAGTLHNLAKVHRVRGRLGEARAACERALRIRVKALGPMHHRTALNHDCVGWVLLEQRRYAEAHGHFERALAIREKTLGKRHGYTGISLTNVAQSFLGMGDTARALHALERAVAIHEAPGQDRNSLAHARFLLAGALRVAGRERARARRLALEARAQWASTGRNAKEVAEVDRWLNAP